MWRRWWRIARVVLAVLAGAITVASLYPFLSGASRTQAKRRWAQRLLAILAVSVDCDIDHALPGSLLVANHISWLDILVINAVLPSAFVAKADVRTWPLLGWLAARNETIFLKRGSRGHARLVNAEIAEKLTAGKYVAVFPEGTTTDGRHVLHFHAALLQPAIAAGRPVVPLALSYWEEGGERSLAPRYDGSISFAQCLVAIADRPRLLARLCASAPLGLGGEDRRQVAQTARQAIIRAAGLPEESNRPEIPDGLPAAPPSGVFPISSRNRGQGGLA